MGGFKRRLMELEEMYGPAWSWSGDWDNPDFYPSPDEDQNEDQVVADYDYSVDSDQIHTEATQSE